MRASATGDFDDDSTNAQITKLIEAYEHVVHDQTIIS
jgi:hypothetical protein